MKQTSSDAELIKRRELSGGKAATINMEAMGIQTSRRKKEEKKTEGENFVVWKGPSYSDSCNQSEQ